MLSSNLLSINILTGVSPFTLSLYNSLRSSDFFFTSSYNPILFAGTPPQTSPSGTFLVTTAPAAVRRSHSAAKAAGWNAPPAETALNRKRWKR